MTPFWTGDRFLAPDAYFCFQIGVDFAGVLGAKNGGPRGSGRGVQGGPAPEKEPTPPTDRPTRQPTRDHLKFKQSSN